MAFDKNKFIDEVKKMTVLELSELVKTIEETFGVSAAAPAAVAGAAVVVEEEKTEFNLVLKDAGASKIGVIKVVREVTGLGLVDAKNMTEKTPSIIKEGISKDIAEELAKKFKDAGADVEIK